MSIKILIEVMWLLPCILAMIRRRVYRISDGWIFPGRLVISSEFSDWNVQRWNDRWRKLRDWVVVCSEHVISQGDGSCVTDPCWYAVPNTTQQAGVTFQLLEWVQWSCPLQAHIMISWSIMRLSSNSATNIQLDNVNLFPIDGKGESDILCDPAFFSGNGSYSGFVCYDGPYQSAWRTRDNSG